MKLLKLIALQEKIPSPYLNGAMSPLFHKEMSASFDDGNGDVDVNGNSNAGTIYT